MKKNQKRQFVIATVANFLKWVLAKHPAYTSATCPNGFNCNCCDECKTLNFMVSLYDKDHKHLASNWSGNADLVYDVANSGNINKAAEAAHIMINHYMWGQADDLLHKVRFIRIGLRSEIESPENGYYINRERGWECEVFTGFVDPYHETWMSGPPEVEEEWEMGCF